MQAYYKGNAVSLGGGTSSGFDPWAVSDATAPTDMATIKNYTSEQIAGLYDDMKTDFPLYITKSVIGKDATNTYNIYQYIFCPDYPEQTIYLQAGVHGNEYDGYLGLLNLMRLICYHWTDHEWLAYLRWKCRIIVVPVVNVCSVSTTHTRNNSNDVNLNRDLDAVSPQPETIAMKTNFEALHSTYTLSFCLDFHTTISANWGGDAAIGDSADSINYDITALVAKTIAKKHCPDRLESYVTEHNLEADELFLPFWFNTGNDGTYSGYFRSFGLVGVTIEYSDYVYSSGQANSDTGRIALELYTNHVIGLAMQKYSVG